MKNIEKDNVPHRWHRWQVCFETAQQRALRIEILKIPPYAKQRGKFTKSNNLKMVCGDARNAKSDKQTASHSTMRIRQWLFYASSSTVYLSDNSMQYLVPLIRDFFRPVVPFEITFIRKMFFPNGLVIFFLSFERFLFMQGNILSKRPFPTIFFSKDLFWNPALTLVDMPEHVSSLLKWSKFQINYL